MQQIGIFGGTFDPVHNGHLAVAGAAIAGAELTRVIFIPSGHSWQKAHRCIAPAEHRVKMVELAISGHPEYSLSRIEVDRPGATYTVDTLEEIKRQFGDSAELYFILGWDALLGAHTWREPEKIIGLCRIIAAPRPDVERPDLEKLEKLIPGISYRLIMLQEPFVDISSSEIRRLIPAGLSWEHLVPPPVAQYIKEKGLYK